MWWPGGSQEVAIGGSLDTALSHQTNLPETIALIAGKSDLALISANPGTMLWYLDSGATSHHGCRMSMVL